MIELNQLRLGNIFRNTSEPLSRHNKKDIFNWSIQDWYALEECTMDIEDVEPIPITEEWLVRLGFKKILGHNVNVSYFRLGDFCLTPYKDGYFINWYRGRTEIKYVHQLQNIFFALTGEELKEIEK